MSGQQKQTLAFFEKEYNEWNKKSSAFEDAHNTIVQRNESVLNVIRDHGQVKTFLDIGCGTGQLVISAAQHSKRSIGVDFSKNMIKQCKENAKHIQNTKFDNLSIFDYNAQDSPFSVISALGFIEYISENELNNLLRMCAGWLEHGGYAVIGSRNRLYNSLSVNSYSELEMEIGCLTELVKESIIFSQVNTDTEALGALDEFNPSLSHPPEHPQTGVDVSLRLQYTPSQLYHALKSVDLVPERIYGINYHAFPPAAHSLVEALHNDIKGLIFSEYSRTPAFIPYSSSFVIAAKKG